MRLVRMHLMRMMGLLHVLYIVTGPFQGGLRVRGALGSRAAVLGRR